MERVRKKICLDIGPNILNLKRWIPQKDVIRLILKLLTKADWKIVWAAHDKTYEKKMKKDNLFWNQCAEDGYLDLIIWGLRDGLRFNESLYDSAAKGGHLHLIKWAMRQKTYLLPKPQDKAVENAIIYQHVHILDFFYNETDYSFSSGDYSIAAKTSAIVSMEFLKKHNVHRNYRNCGTAATHGQLDALKWLRTNGCPWTELVVIEATRHKHYHVLEWAIKNGCPYNMEMLQNIARNDERDLRYLFDNSFMDIDEL